MMVTSKTFWNLLQWEVSKFMTLRLSLAFEFIARGHVMVIDPMRLTIDGMRRDEMTDEV
jgi:hypothetical protein